MGEWKSWGFQQYPAIAHEIWDLLSRDKIAAGSIDAALEGLPKRATGKGKARQQWLVKPDRTRALDTDFLEFLDKNRRDLASDIYKNNDHSELLDGDRLTEACQRIIDRILFLRICEDRDIDTGMALQSIVETWRKNTGNGDTGRRAQQQPFDSLREEPAADFGNSGIRAPKDSLWRAVVRHFRALDRRPPTHVPFFNGNLFKPHFTEGLIIGDEWLAGFINELSADESPYLFNEIPVEILGSVYERFLGKVVRPHGRGIVIEEKPEVRKAGGVYYTPRYIVDYIVEQTAGKLLDEIAGTSAASGAVPPHPDPLPPGEGTAADAARKTSGSGSGPARTASLPLPAGEGRGEGERPPPAVTLKDFEKRTAALRLLDPACGSGSFLIRAFERVCEHWQKRLTAGLPPKEQKAERAAWEKKHRPLCWVDAETNDVHLTVALKRQILTQNIYGVDLDAAAVEVTQLSLYLKMLENENRTTLQRQRELLADETDIALLPPLQDNIKCGNSLIASDFSMMPEDLVRVHAFDWPVQFQSIMRAGGFDAVIGNPPYVRQESLKESKDYFEKNYESFSGTGDLYTYFMEKGVKLIRPGGRYSIIVSSSFLRATYAEALRETLLKHAALVRIVDFGGLAVFADAKDTYVCIPVLVKDKQSDKVEVSKVKTLETDSMMTEMSKTDFIAPLQQFKRDGWQPKSAAQNDLFQKLVKAGVSLGQYLEGRIFYGIKTGLNEVFVINSETRQRLIQEDKRSAEIIKPVRGGEDIREYFLEPTDAYLIFTRRGVNIEKYPAVKAYLEQFRPDLTPKKSGNERRGRKPGPYRWHEIQDDVAYFEIFD